MINDRSGVYSSGRPSNPPFLRMRVRRTFLTSVLVAFAIVVGTFTMVVLFAHKNVTLVEHALSPGVILVTFTVTLLNQLFLRGHFCRIADFLKVGEGLAFWFSLTLLLASFVGTLVFMG